MPDTGWIIAGTGANNADAGDAAWTNPSNILAQDTNYANYLAKNNSSQYLHATNFALSSVPDASVIVGVEARIRRAQDGTGIADHTVQLIAGGTRQGSNKADLATAWTGGSVQTNKDYGGPADLWGLALTPAIVKASNFGLAIRAATLAGFENGSVDAVWLRVHFALPSRRNHARLIA